MCHLPQASTLPTTLSLQALDVRYLSSDVNGCGKPTRVSVIGGSGFQLALVHSRVDGSKKLKRRLTRLEQQCKLVWLASAASDSNNSSSYSPYHLEAALIDSRPVNKSHCPAVYHLQSQEPGLLIRSTAALPKPTNRSLPHLYHSTSSLAQPSLHKTPPPQEPSP